MTHNALGNLEQAEPTRDDPLLWPERFQAKHGRRPRVLHICNVANYAYVNAKLMRQHGIDADVLDPDFYHIMASPEWHELPLQGDHGDDFQPDWSRMNLGDYKRPEWFMQGPSDLVFQWLAARNQGQSVRAGLLRNAADRFRVSYSNADHAVSRLLASKHPVATRLKALIKRVLRGPLPKSLPNAAAATPEGDEFLSLRQKAHQYRAAFEGYDVIQGYTTGAMYPALLGLRNYTAYELGTLRGLPFEDSTAGRLTAFIYQNAPHVFITNVDCVTAAERLGIGAERYDCVPHAYDLDDVMAFSQEWHRSHSPAGDEIPYFFAPARHHWKEGNLSWLKGNHVIIRAAGLLNRKGRKFRIRFVEWGIELDQSRDLIREEGIEHLVEWIRPQSRHSVWPHYLGSVGILDQFSAAALGGVALDTMALGKRLLTRYDHEAGRQFFESAPPIDSANTPEELAVRMEAALDDPADSRGEGLRGQEWMRREHSIERQMRQHFLAYQRILGA